jgi:outer membrane biosynthesis protein TonB
VTGPDEEPRTDDRPAEPTVSTAPVDPPPPRRLRVPGHIGRARTSTVLLALAFLAIGLLYLFVRPDPVDAGGGDADPASTTARTTSGQRSATTAPPEETTPATPSSPVTTPTTTPPTTTTPGEPTGGTTPTPTEDAEPTTPDEPAVPTTEPETTGEPDPELTPFSPPA